MIESRKYLRALQGKGRIHFSTEEFIRSLSVSKIAANAALRRMREQHLIATPIEGFHLILGPEYENLGCPPADQFIDQLMMSLGIEYYVGFLSAAELHGAAHQRPQVYQVAVSAQRRDLKCGEVTVGFIKRKEILKIPVSRINTRTGQIRVSTPAATAFDLVSAPALGAGLNNVATVLAELHESLKPNQLAEVSELFPVIVGQRLGFLLDLVGAKGKTEALLKRLSSKMKSYTPLEPRRMMTGANRDRRWKVAVNTVVEPDI